MVKCELFLVELKSLPFFGSWVVSGVEEDELSFHLNHF